MISLFNLGAIAKQPSAKQTYDNFFRKAKSASESYPQENAYLHFDNISYYSGDTIWYKAYVSLSNTIKPAHISTPVYVEMLSPNGTIVDKQIIKISDTGANGRFILNHDVEPGYYEIRAYTKWMTGFSDMTYFSRTFPIYKPEINNSKRTISEYSTQLENNIRKDINNTDFNLKFFPESGNLIEGIDSKVAFIAESRDGEVININGKIFDYEGNEITSFASEHNGMGYFRYKPTNKPALAKVNYKGYNYEFPLPEALSTGYVISLENNIESITASVYCSAYKSNDSIALFISQKGNPVDYKTFSFHNKAPFVYTVKAKDIPDGILQFTVINRQGQVLAERQAFSYPKMPVEISVSEGPTIYPPYSYIKYDIHAFDAPEQPVKGVMSVSVTDAIHSDYIEFDNTIFTDKLLTSQLKGYIHNPGYYFSDLSSKKVKELDLLMMVNGWRKYNMSEYIGAIPFVAKHNAEKQLTVNGKIKNNKTEKRRYSDILLSVIMHQEDKKMTSDCYTERDGTFSIALDDFYNNASGRFSAEKSMKNRNNELCINIENSFAPEPRPYDFYEYNPTWVSNNNLYTASLLFDSVFTDSLVRSDTYKMIIGIDSKEKNYNRNIILNTCPISVIDNPESDKISELYTEPVFISCTQQTIIQGYEEKYEHFTPTYNINRPLNFTKKDKRRTLYWNPELRTDNDGKATIEFFNNQFSTPVMIRIEMITDDGKVASYTYTSMKR